MSAFGPVPTTYHLHLCVRGALRDFSKRQLKGMFRLEGGRECTADEAKDNLLECLAQGKEVLPFGLACEGFDFAGGGCPGHVHPAPVELVTFVPTPPATQGA